MKISLQGGFQRDNAAAALAALEQIQGKGFRISDDAVRSGLANVERLTGLKARMQVTGRRPLTICDVAHNPDAARMLADSLRTIARGEVHLIFGVMKDKEFRPMIRTFGALGPRFYAVEAKIERSLPARELQAAIAEEGYAAECHRTIASALRAARKNASPRDTILVTGSHYVVGEAMVAMKRGRRGKRSGGKKLT